MGTPTYATSNASNDSGSSLSQADKHQQYKLMNEITKVQHRMNSMQRNVDMMAKTVSGVDLRMSEVERKTKERHSNCTKAEKLIIKMIGKLQNDVEGSKDEIN